MDSEVLKKRSKQGALISLLGFLIVLAGFAFASWRLKELNTVIVSKTADLESVSDSVNIQRSHQTKLIKRNESLTLSIDTLVRALDGKNLEIKKLTISIGSLSKTARDLHHDLQEKKYSITMLNDSIKLQSDSLMRLKRQFDKIQFDLVNKKDSVRILDSKILDLRSQLLEVESERKALNSFLEKYGDDNSKVEPRASTQKADKEGEFYYEIWLQITPTMAKKIKSVAYFFNHSSFKNPRVNVDSPSNDFRTGYKGWGCLENMPITITYKNGKEETLIFKMCEFIKQDSIKADNTMKNQQKKF